MLTAFSQELSSWNYSRILVCIGAQGPAGSEAALTPTESRATGPS